MKKDLVEKRLRPAQIGMSRNIGFGKTAFEKGLKRAKCHCKKYAHS